jgi:hypothetical protein
MPAIVQLHGSAYVATVSDNPAHFESTDYQISPSLFENEGGEVVGFLAAQ